MRDTSADRANTLSPAPFQARKAHPVLRRYSNNWASAAIARQYMQNKHKHAYKQGYIKKKDAALDKENGPGDDEGAAGGAAASCA